MEKYNLDDKGGLFKFVEKKASKVLKNGDPIELKHFQLPGAIKGKVSDVTESTFRLQADVKAPDAVISLNDHVALEYVSSGTTYEVTGTVNAVNGKDPVDVIINLIRIEKLKDIAKEKKYYVSLSASVKIIGVAEPKNACITAISLGGIKMYCNEDLMNEDIIEITYYIDKNTKMNFKGKIVRKNKVNDTFEYGLEYAEVGESYNKVITRILYDNETRN